MRSLRRHIRLPIFAIFLSAAPVLAFQGTRIGEILTSYDFFVPVQFVELETTVFNDNQAANTVLAAFDASGTYLGDVLVVSSDLPLFFNLPAKWLPGTAGIGIVAGGVHLDFEIPASLPVGGGMICWGAPASPAPDPGTWNHADPENYVDCVAYGSYSGPANSRIGSATALDADGHSLVRVLDTRDNASDFLCGDPATPEINSAGFFRDVFPATTPCPVPNNYTLPAPLAFSGNGISGTVNPVTSPSAVAGMPDCTFLTPCLFPYGDSFVFSVSLDPGSNPVGSVAALFLGFSARAELAGFFPDVGATGPSPFTIINVAGSRGHLFKESTGEGEFLLGGQTTEVLFVSFPTGAIATALPLGRQVRFRFWEGAGISTPTIESAAVAPVQMPEPSRAALIAWALAGLSFLGCRRRGQ